MSFFSRIVFLSLHFNASLWVRVPKLLKMQALRVLDKILSSPELGNSWRCRQLYPFGVRSPIRPKKFVYLGVIKHLLPIRHVLHFPGAETFKTLTNTLTLTQTFLISLMKKFKYKTKTDVKKIPFYTFLYFSVGLVGIPPQRTLSCSHSCCCSWQMKKTQRK